MDQIRSIFGEGSDLKIFEGYAVDAVPAVLFLRMAVMCACLIRCDATDQAYPRLAAALVLSAIQRGNLGVGGATTRYIECRARQIT